MLKYVYSKYPLVVPILLCNLAINARMSSNWPDTGLDKALVVLGQEALRLLLLFLIKHYYGL